MTALRAVERLIIAADYPPDRCAPNSILGKVLDLADLLKGTGVLIKVNSALRFWGYRLIGELHERDLGVFADLKLCDIPATMRADAQLLSAYGPELLTVMCSAGVEAMAEVVDHIGPATTVLGVTILTSLDEEECQGIFGCSTKAGVVRFARFAKEAGLSDLILSPKEIEAVKKRRRLELVCNTPGIRPEWAEVTGDDQKRTMTVRGAIAAGAERLVIGRPITQAKSPLDAVKRTLEEIEQGLQDRTDKAS